MFSISGVKCQGSGGYGSRDYLGDHELTSLIMKDDVIFSLPLLSMTLIMSEEYHQELSTSTLHSPSMRPRDSSQSELLDFISWNLSPDLWTFSKKYCVSLQSLSIQNSLRAMKRRQLLVCLIILDLTFVLRPQPSQENTFLIGESLVCFSSFFFILSWTWVLYPHFSTRQWCQVLPFFLLFVYKYYKFPFINQSVSSLAVLLTALFVSNPRIPHIYKHTTPQAASQNPVLWVTNWTTYFHSDS